MLRFMGLQRVGHDCGELRPPMPGGQKNQSINQKQYCNKQRLKNGPHYQKKNFKKYLQIFSECPLGRGGWQTHPWLRTTSFQEDWA